MHRFSKFRNQDSTLKNIHNKSDFLLFLIDKLCNQKLLKFAEKYDIENKTHTFKTLKHEQILNANVVGSTCSNATANNLSEIKFDTLIVDESTQAKDVEVLIPIVNGIKKIVLIGDQKQLGPMIRSKAAKNAGFGTSLFERFISAGVCIKFLNIQYRMHPLIVKFPNAEFYKGLLLNGVSELQRTDERTRMIFEKPVIFENVNCGEEELSENGLSYLNQTESKLIVQYVKKLLNADVDAKEIGVISPYEGQKKLLSKKLEIYNVQVANIDGFQGTEKNYILMSCVRSNRHQDIGFLEDENRLNVALTRAKYGLVIVGNCFAYLLV